MIRQPAVQRATRGLKKALSDFLSAPVGGWNARDPRELMKPTDAVVLENWFPTPNSVESRGGFQQHKTGFAGDPLKTLMAWNGASPKLFASTQTAIYDVTASGAHGASLQSLTIGKLSHTNFAVAGGQYLVAVNGVDTLKLYNGTTWASIDGSSVPAITGLATSTLTSVAVCHRRLWFTVANSSSVYYLPVAQVGGALAEFPLGQVFTRGGYVVAIGTWSMDPGIGRDDYTVFVSSQGELAVYKGSDPTTAADFAKVGVYNTASPIGGFNCLSKYGGDLLYLCELGLFPISKLLSAQTLESLALTDRINKAFTDAVKAYGGNTNWQVLPYQKEQALLVNIPVTADYSEQYVMNMLTGAWARFTGWPCASMAVFNSGLYAGAAEYVSLLWVDGGDDGEIIRCRAQSAYNYFGRRGQVKHMKLVSPVVESTGGIPTYTAVDADFRMNAVFSLTGDGGSGSGLWDSALWDSAVWAGDFSVGQGWHTVRTPEAFAYSMIFVADAGEAKIRLIGYRVIGVLGGML